MPLAYVLVNAEIGADDEALEAIKKIPNVKEAYLVYGVYDIVVKVEAESLSKLKEVVTTRIRRLNKVRSTLTMIVMSLQ